QCEPLLLPLRQPLHGKLAAPPEPHLLQHPQALALPARAAFERTRELQVLCGGEIVLVPGPVTYVRHLGTPRRASERHRFALPGNALDPRFRQASQRAQQRRLAAAVRTHHGERAAAGDCEADPLEQHAPSTLAAEATNV